jgi:hypothetical protein
MTEEIVFVLSHLPEFPLSPMAVWHPQNSSVTFPRRRPTPDLRPAASGGGWRRFKRLHRQLVWRAQIQRRFLSSHGRYGWRRRQGEHCSARRPSECIWALYNNYCHWFASTNSSSALNRFEALYLLNQCTMVMHDAVWLSDDCLLV